MIQEGAQSDDIHGYKLPVTDVDTAKRNFPGYEKKQWYTLDELRSGDIMGTTDTDSETDKKVGGVKPYNKSEAYTKIQRKGPKMRGFKSSSPRTKEN